MMWEPGVSEGLTRSDFFSELDQGTRESLSRLAFFRKYSTGQIIFYQDEPGEAMYYVDYGRVKIVKEDWEGKEQILHIMKSGDIFGEVVLFDEGPYPATAEALEATRVGVITKESFDRHMISHPQTALKMMRLLGQRLRKAQSKVADLALKDTYWRTIKTLYHLMREDDCAFCEQKSEIAIPATHHEIAGMVGTTRESITRVLSVLKNEGIINTKKGCIWITAPGTLMSKLTDEEN